MNMTVLYLIVILASLSVSQKILPSDANLQINGVPEQLFAGDGFLFTGGPSPSLYLSNENNLEFLTSLELNCFGGSFYPILSNGSTSFLAICRNTSVYFFIVLSIDLDSQHSLLISSYWSSSINENSYTIYGDDVGDDGLFHFAVAANYEDFVSYCTYDVTNGAFMNLTESYDLSDVSTSIMDFFYLLDGSLVFATNIDNGPYFQLTVYPLLGNSNSVTTNSSSAAQFSGTEDGFTIDPPNDNNSNSVIRSWRFSTLDQLSSFEVSNCSVSAYTLSSLAIGRFFFQCYYATGNTYSTTYVTGYDANGIMETYSDYPFVQQAASMVASDDYLYVGQITGSVSYEVNRYPYV